MTTTTSASKIVRRLLAGIAMLAVLGPGAVDAAGVRALFDLDSPTTAPFPSDRFTVPDEDQLTGRRVALPLPDCTVSRTDCEDVAVINTLDGFNLQPRLSIPFSGQIEKDKKQCDPRMLRLAAKFLADNGMPTRKLSLKR